MPLALTTNRIPRSLSSFLIGQEPGFITNFRFASISKLFKSQLWEKPELLDFGFDLAH